MLICRMAIDRMAITVTRERCCDIEYHSERNSTIERHANGMSFLRNVHGAEKIGMFISYNNVSNNIRMATAKPSEPTM